MGRDSWFRNTAWDDVIEAEFVQHLRRSKDKQQHLRIQASILVATHPNVALRLLDECFALGDFFDSAQAHVDRAYAHLALGNVDAAMGSLEAALSRERSYPNVLTSAYLDLPLLIVRQSLTDRYDRALTILAENRERPQFPFERYHWFAATALLQWARGRPLEAEEAARHALDATLQKHSGFRKHPRLGLVQAGEDDLLSRIRRIAQMQ